MLVNFRGYVVEMSVPGLVIVLVLAVSLRPCARRGRRCAAALARSARAAAARAPRQRPDDRSHATSIEGNWARSERVLTQGLKHADAPLANYLLAAHAAQLQGAADRRDQWLELAQGVSADGATSALLTRAELQLAAGEPGRGGRDARDSRAAEGRPTRSDRVAGPRLSRARRSRSAARAVAAACARAVAGRRARRARDAGSAGGACAART